MKNGIAGKISPGAKHGILLVDLSQLISQQRSGFCSAIKTCRNLAGKKGSYLLR